MIVTIEPGNILNVEFKAKVADASLFEDRLKALGPRFIGVDHQVDTYFHVQQGRLKLREGNIEQALIHYERADIAGAKSSSVILYQSPTDPALKRILSLHLGIKTVVDKQRRIYFIDNVKFHFDRVEGLGDFVEVEAIDQDGSKTREVLELQCRHYAQVLGIPEDAYMRESYSDMLLQRQ